MPPITDAELRTLRQKYHCAFTAHQSCVQARNHVVMTGKLPSAELLEQEAVALRELADARARQLAGWTELAHAHGTHEPPHIRMLSDR